MFDSPIRFARLLTRAGIPIPKAATAELATLETLAEATQVDYVAAAKADAAAGKVTAKTAASHLHNLADALIRAERFEEAARHLEQPIVARWYTALRDSEDELFAALVTAAAGPLSVVQEAGRHFGTDATPDEVLSAGIDAVTVWEQLTQALGSLDLIRNLRVQLGDVWRQGEPSVTWWIAGADNGDHLAHAHLIYTRPGNTFHNLAEAGFDLQVNTAAQASAVARGARTEDTKRQRIEADAKASALREVNAIRLAN